MRQGKKACWKPELNVHEFIEMKSTTTRSTVLACLLVAMAGAAAPLSLATQAQGIRTSANEVQSEVADAAEAIRDYTADRRDEAVQEVKEALQALDERIDRLESRIDEDWERMSQASRKQTRAAIKELRKQRSKVAEWYGGLKYSSAETWEHVKQGFSDAYQALSSAWDKAENEFQGNSQ
jgi:chromosome segregation ATPase